MSSRSLSKTQGRVALVLWREERIMAYGRYAEPGLWVLLTTALLCGAPAEGRAQEEPVALEGTVNRLADIYRPRISSFLVGSSSYASGTQIVPEFAGGAPAPTDPKTANFRFDKFGIAVVQRFTPWLSASAMTEVESHRDRHSHGFDPDFGCPGTGPCVEQFGAEAAEIAVSLDRFDVTASIPVANRPTVSIGRFDVPFGFERHDEPLMLTATTSDVFRFGRPERMTGFLASYAFSPWLDVTAWVVNRWESETAGEADFNDNNRAKSLGGRLGLTPAPVEGLLNIGIGGFWGPEQNGATQNKRWVVDLDFSWTPARRLFLTGEILHGEEANRSLRERGVPVAAPAAVRDVAWTGGYVLGHYDIVDWLGLGARYGVLDDRDGGRTGVAQTLQSFTVAPVLHLSRLAAGLGLSGAAYGRSRHPIDWVDLRLEYRLNRSDRPVFADAEPGVPISAADRTGQQFSVLLVVNSIFR
jgi:hypothetical protein